MDIKEYLLDYYIKTNGETITPELASSLVEEMAVTDGSSRENGERWSMSECKDAGLKLNVDFNTISPAEWYLVMNMMYSDYYSVGRRHNMTDYPFYSEMALAWFEDVDGEDNKTFKYFFC